MPLRLAFSLMPVVREKLMVLRIVTSWMIDVSVFRDVFRRASIPQQLCNNLE